LSRGTRVTVNTNADDNERVEVMQVAGGYAYSAKSDAE
jgi:hypothetical protein